MNNTPDYLYAGVPRAPRSTRRLIIDLYAGNDLAVTKEDPIVPLLIRTDDEMVLERHIHNTLRAEHRHLQNTNTNEDFLTCPSEVAQIFFDSPHCGCVKRV